MTNQFLLWIDAVGGYLVSMRDEVVLGQPISQSKVDIPILGDISGRHAKISRDGEGYLIEAFRPVWVNGRAVRQSAMLADGSVVQLGSAVKLSFRRPHALSATARLDFLSSHRTQPSVDGVLLMADSCVLGPRPQSHVVCGNWPNEVVLFRHGDRLQCRTRGWLEIDGSQYTDRGPVGFSSRIVGEKFCMSLEAF
ncbi:MAG: FHA domain-containing protein [Rhodopirellula sp.]|nr:FHA domain-containing protein [Rhodopirellula sp.]